MPLSDEHREYFGETCSQIVAYVASSLSMFLNDEIQIENTGFTNIVTHGENVEIEQASVIAEVHLAEEAFGSLRIIIPTNAVLQMTAAMMGNETAAEAFDEDQERALITSLQDTLNETFNQIPAIRDSAQYNITEIKIRSVDPANTESLQNPSPNSDLLAIGLKSQFKGQDFQIQAELSADLASQVTMLLMNAEQQEAEAERETNSAGNMLGSDFSDILNSHNPDDIDEEKNLNLLLDIRLGLIVELGRAEMPLRDILKLTKGSIIELDRLSGEPVDLFVNNKLVARGEVVVIDDSFGLRITQLAGTKKSADELIKLSMGE